jgi:hypothetical protein
VGAGAGYMSADEEDSPEVRRRKTIFGAILGAGGGAGIGALSHGGGPITNINALEDHYKARLQLAEKVMAEADRRIASIPDETTKKIFETFQERPDLLLKYHKMFTEQPGPNLSAAIKGSIE